MTSKGPFQPKGFSDSMILGGDWGDKVTEREDNGVGYLPL